ncbi:MAG: hypothetical protein AB1551_07870 [Actinomycetota bacterium]
MRMLGGYGTATGKPARHGYVVARSSRRKGEANASPEETNHPLGKQEDRPGRPATGRRFRAEDAGGRGDRGQ